MIIGINRDGVKRCDWTKYVTTGNDDTMPAVDTAYNIVLVDDVC